jgi:hypothetical protein
MNGSKVQGPKSEVGFRFRLTSFKLVPRPSPRTFDLKP